MGTVPVSIVLLSIAVLVSGCQLPFGSRKAPQPVHLVYWGDESPAVIQPLIDEYLGLYPNSTITYRQQPQETYRMRLSARLRSKREAESPDMVRFPVVWLPMLSELLSQAPQGVVTDIAREYPKAVLDAVTNRDVVYGVPLSLDGLVMLANEDMFADKGVSAPKTWEEFGKTARSLTVRDNTGTIQIAGASIGTMDNVENASELLGVMLAQAGVDLANLSGKPEKNTQKLTQDVLSFYTSFAKGNDRIWDDSFDSSLIAFANDRVAIVFAPTYRIREILTENPRIKMRAYPIPQLSAQGQKSTGGSFWIEGVVASSPNKDAAWEFIHWLSQPTQLFKLSGERAKALQFTLAYPRSSMFEKHIGDRYLEAVVAQVPSMRTFPLLADPPDQGINDQLVKSLTRAVEAVREGKPADATVSQLDSDFTQILKQYD